ncbi:MAG: hypothetical protein AB7P04_01760 [Bacteriovoracia bacterium]
MKSWIGLSLGIFLALARPAAASTLELKPSPHFELFSSNPGVSTYRCFLPDVGPDGQSLLLTFRGADSARDTDPEFSRFRPGLYRVARLTQREGKTSAIQGEYAEDTRFLALLWVSVPFKAPQEIAKLLEACGLKISLDRQDVDAPAGPKDASPPPKNIPTTPVPDRDPLGLPPDTTPLERRDFLFGNYFFRIQGMNKRQAWEHCRKISLEDACRHQRACHWIQGECEFKNLADSVGMDHSRMCWRFTYQQRQADCEALPHCSWVPPRCAIR